MGDTQQTIETRDHKPQAHINAPTLASFDRRLIDYE
jgi:hypothetical protein